MSAPTAESRTSIINAIKTPLAFLVFGLSIVEVTLGSLVVTIPEHRLLLIGTVIISIFAFVFIVTGLAIWRPEALSGDRPLQKAHANRFAGDLYIALDGALKNLESKERNEAWITVADIISSDSPDDSYARFCSSVGIRLKSLANLRDRTVGTQGSIRP